MGLRLNIEIVKNGKTLANAYYHWSAYSDEACKLTKQAVNFMKNHFSNCDDVLYAIRILESTGAGLPKREPITDIEEIKYIQSSYKKEFWKEMLFPISELDEALKKFPNTQFKECEGRNKGLIAITDKGIEDNRAWEEGRVTINVDTDTIKFNVFINYNPDYYYENTEPNFKKLGLDLNNLKFDELDKLLGIIKQSENDFVYELNDGTKIIFIE